MRDDAPGSFLARDDGTIAILFALALILITGGVGLAIDFGRLMQARTAAQEALDAATLAAAQADPLKRKAVADKLFAAGVKLAQPRVELENINLLTHPVANGVESRVRATMKTRFFGALGVKTMAIDLTTRVERAPDAGVCILVLADAPQALLVNSGATIEPTDCGMHVRSTANPAAIFNAGSDLGNNEICVAGDTIIDNGGHHPGLATSCTAIGDPYAGSFPAPSSAVCDFPDANYGSDVTLTPGVYCGWHNFNSGVDVDFDPGVYVVKGGGWNVNGGDWRGDDVSFYFADESRIQFNSAVDARLRAPKAGPYAGVVFFEAPGLAKSQFVFNDSRNFDMQGLVYLPSRDVTFNSGATVATKEFALVVNTLILDEVNWRISKSAPSLSGGAGDFYISR